MNKQETLSSSKQREINELLFMNDLVNEPKSN